MTREESTQLSRQQQAELNDTLAALIASTKRTNRKLDLLTIAEKLSTAKKHLGSLQLVASAVGLSSEMLRQFSRVETLAPPVKAIVKTGGITSVDIADRISRLPPGDQAYVARKVVAGELDSGDVRDILAHRKNVPSLPISKVVREVLASKNIREYVIEFPIPSDCDQRKVESRLGSFFGQRDVYDIEIKGHIGQACLTDRGRRRLMAAAKEQHMTKRRFLDRQLSRGDTI